MTDDALARVETACAELADAGEVITFSSIAVRAHIGRATLYRRPELRAVVDEHRARARDAQPCPGSRPRSAACAARWRPSPRRSADTRRPSAG